VEQQRGCIAEPVHAADALAAATQLGPVGEARGGCRNGGENASGDQPIGRLLAIPATDQIEEQ
jgi:hypothetical protein